MEETNQIIIQCNKCKKKNAINLSKPVQCKHCDNTLTKHKAKKVAAITAAAIVIALGSGHALDDMFEANRYPVSEEFAILESCYSASSRPLNYRDYYKKRETCNCALVKTQASFDYSEYLNDEDAFLNEFEKQAKDCP